MRLFNTPTLNKNLATVAGFFIQDAWSIGRRVTLNLGFRFDNYKGTLPEQSNQDVQFDLFTPTGLEPDGTGPYIGPRTGTETEVINHSKSVWRAGLVYDLTGDGRTAFKTNYSRYALQVGIDRVTNVNPLTVGSRTCPWTDPNGDGKFQESEINFAQCGAFSGGLTTSYATDGIGWPRSDGFTAGVERQLGRRCRGRDVLLPQQSRPARRARRGAADERLHGVHRQRAERPGGPTTATVYNLAPELVEHEQPDSRQSLRARYHLQGRRVHRRKRLSNKWQMVAGLTFGKNRGGQGGGDLNDRAIFSTRPASSATTRRSASGCRALPAAVRVQCGRFDGVERWLSVRVELQRHAPIASAAGVSLTRTSQTVSLASAATSGCRRSRWSTCGSRA